MNIPVRNIYFLLVYAWNELEAAEALDVHCEDHATLDDLLADMLCRAVQRLFSRGIDRGYADKDERMALIRGRIDFPASVKAQVLDRGLAICRVQEFDYDVLHNRLLSASLRALTRRRPARTELNDRIESLSLRLSHIPDVSLDDASFRRVQLHRNNRHYKLPLSICQLLRRAGLLDDRRGEHHVDSYLQRPEAMRRLFERFVRNFIAHEVPDAKLLPRRIPWDRLEAPAPTRARVPSLQSDVRLLHKGQHLIIETKFISDPLRPTPFGGDRFIPAHLQQLLTYATQSDAEHPLRTAGLLLYPFAARHCDDRFRIGDVPLRVATLDLSAPWSEIRRRLIELATTDMFEPMRGWDARAVCDD